MSPSVSFIATIIFSVLVASSSHACIVYGDHGKVIIGMSYRGHGYWTGLNDGSVMYKSWTRDPYVIDNPGGDYNARIFLNFQVPYTSEYIITANSVALHHTENNDVWLRVWNGRDRPHGLYRRCQCNLGDRQELGAGYLKAYQNSGGSSIELWTIDHNPHAITGYFEAGRTYTLELSGRSMSFRIKAMMLVACQGTECSPRSATVMRNLNSGMAGMACL